MFSSEIEGTNINAALAMANKSIRTAPKPLFKTNKVESISQYGGKITNYGLVHGEQSVQLRLELWLGNAMITIDN